MRISGQRLIGMRPSGMRPNGMRPTGMRPNGMRLKGCGSRERGLKECGPTACNPRPVYTLNIILLTYYALQLVATDRSIVCQLYGSVGSWNFHPFHYVRPAHEHDGNCTSVAYKLRIIRSYCKCSTKVVAAIRYSWLDESALRQHCYVSSSSHMIIMLNIDLCKKKAGIFLEETTCKSYLQLQNIEKKMFNILRN